MDKQKATKSVKAKEIERKYTINTFEKSSLWDREFIVFQWFIENLETKETKLKVIIDLLSVEKKYVRITKDRLSNEEANKTVDYLKLSAINFDDLQNLPFVCKRRSIKDHIHLDKFIFSNGLCQFLLVDEGNKTELNDFCKANEIELKENVTD